MLLSIIIGKGFYVIQRKVFPRGEGAELARRMRCHRAESVARFSFVAALCDVEANKE